MFRKKLLLIPQSPLLNRHGQVDLGALVTPPVLRNIAAPLDKASAEEIKKKPELLRTVHEVDETTPLSMRGKR